MSGAIALAAATRLASRDATRTEAELQEDVYVLLTAAGLSLGPDEVGRLEIGPPIPREDGHG